MIRSICVVTGSRAEYGLLRWVMQGVKDDPDLVLQVIATGMHLAPEFGLTYLEIEQDGFSITHKVEMLTSSDTPVGIAKSMGLGLIGFADALNALKPTIVVMLGDRFELLSAASAALVAGIPIAHLHGGESTEGAFDDSIRHAVTKMAYLHFVATDEYRQRVIQLGEQPDRVFVVGGLGVDSIMRTRILDRAELESALDFSLGKKSLLVTFHPVTLESEAGMNQLTELLSALHDFSDTQLVFTMPNADTNGRAMAAMIERFVSEHSNARAYTSLGQLRYFSCMAHVDGLVGNSSSGLLEAPSFRKGVVNIGERQRGRLKAASVIDCEPDRHSIMDSIKKLYSAEFQATVRSVSNPYGDGGASEQVVHILKNFSLAARSTKEFYDLPRRSPECES